MACVVGGHADTLREPEKRTALLERVLRPLLMRFGDHPAVLAWEVMHAPDRRTLDRPAREPQARTIADPDWRGVRSRLVELGRVTGFRATSSRDPSVGRPGRRCGSSSPTR